MPDGWSSEVLPGLLLLALALGLIVVVFWLGVGRPIVRYLRRSPCPQCHLSVSGPDDVCPHCGASLHAPDRSASA